MSAARLRVPVWVMGLANLPFGLAGGFLLVTLPQLLAARHVGEEVIAQITALALVAGFANVVVAPVLDVGISRRAWSLVTGLATALMALASLAALDHLGLLAVLAFTGNLMAGLFTAALGGWLGAALPKELDRQLGVWFQVGNGGGFGIGALLHIVLYRALPAPFGALAVVAVIALPLALLPLLPLPPSERRGLRESFARLAADIARLVRQPYVLRCLLLFTMPCATFALTNIFGGIGADFRASEQLVAAVSGLGVTLTVLVTAPVTGRLLNRVPPAPLYMLTGVVGAGFSLTLLAMPHSPATLVLAVVGENVFQVAAFTCANAIIFRSIEPDSPLAATQFALLYGAVAVPLAYMQALDGRGYGVGHLAGALLTDAGVSLAACALLALPVLRWHKARGFEPTAA